jgi:hypothetical protein
MLLKTSTIPAPWTIVEGNSKYYSRVKVLRTVVEKLSQELQYDPMLDEQKPKSEHLKKKKR